MFKQEQRQAIPGFLENEQQPKNKTDDERLAQMGYEDYGDENVPINDVTTEKEEVISKVDKPDYKTISKNIHDELDDVFIDEDFILKELEKLGNEEINIVTFKEFYRQVYGTSLEAELRDRFEDEDVLKKYIGELTSTKTPVINFSQGKLFHTDREYKKADNFQDIVRLFKAAEDLLIENGYTDMDERIKILRGIYYGTTWSMDFVQEKSGMRNYGFDLYTSSSSRPIDPQTILGKSLFMALRESPEVKDGERSVDIGHLIIGLEARTKSIARERKVLFNGGTGLEIVTWLGDIGGGAGMLAMRRAENPNTRAKSLVFNASGNDYGCKINLEGDVAAYVVGRDKEETDDPSYPEIKEYAYVSDAIADYLLLKNNKTKEEWNNRVKLFAEMLGFEFETGTLKNKEDITDQLKDQIFDFADNYAVIRSNDKKELGKDKALKISVHLKGASEEVAKIFVDLIEKCALNSSKQLIAELDTDPSPAGEPAGAMAKIAKGLQSAQEIFDKYKKGK